MKIAKKRFHAAFPKLGDKDEATIEAGMMLGIAETANQIVVFAVIWS